MAIDPGRVKALFQAAIERGDRAERAAFLDREVGDDAELRARLDALLAAYDRPPGVLDRPLDADPQATIDADPNATVAPPSASPTQAGSPTLSYRRDESPTPLDTVIAGRYKLRQEIGEGGMGSVYLAEQTQPVRRQVALKLIKAGMDSRTVLARFESERQALALMDHPHIAKVLDAGTTEQGRPFFVMELVKGIPLTDYCDRHRLDLPAHLALFRQICSAVQHAHQKGIIHRDLKPTNILVESHDGKPVPKVIDFGLAKATSGMQLSEHSLFTAFGSVTGTPLYMAPEQATFNALDVDTRADIYALGVILYELLAGSTPIPRGTFKRAALDEMLRVIREVEPPTPSSRIGSSDTLPSLAASRHIEPSRLSRFVRGDLDWIVMKALAKERDRRYDSAIGLANDVERFTNHEPVSAGPPTAAYRLKKFVRRNRGRVIAASVVLLTIIGGIIGTTLGLVEARKRLAQKDKANEILLSIFRDLDPLEGDKDMLPLSERLGHNLDLATAALEGEATDDPLGVALMQTALGRAQHGLGYPEKAIPLFSMALATFTSQLGSYHRATLACMGNLVNGYMDMGKLDLALPLQEQTMALSKSKLGPDHPVTLRSMGNLANSYLAAGKYDLAFPLLEQTLELNKSKLGPEHPDTLTSMYNLAIGYQYAGRLDLALTLNEKTLAMRRSGLGPGHPATLLSMNGLAHSQQAAGRLDLALPLLEQALALSKSKLGLDHPYTLESMNNLALVYQAAGKINLALPLHEEALAFKKSKMGPDHPNTLTSMNNLAMGYLDAGKLSLALPLFEQTLAMRRSKLGVDHPYTLASMGNLANGYLAADRLDLALPLFEQTLALKKSKLGPDHPDTLASMGGLANGYLAAGRLDLALPLLEQTLALSKSKLGPDHPNTLTSMYNLALGYQAAGRLDFALPLFEQTLAMRKSKLGPDHPDTLASMGGLANGYLAAGRLDLALPLLEQTLALSKSKLGPDHPVTLGSMNNLASGYKDTGKPDCALPLMEETLALSKLKLGPDHFDTLKCMNNLARTYEDLGEHARALPLLRDVEDRMKRKNGSDSIIYAAVINSLGMNLVRQSMWEEAESALRSALAIRESKQPDVWSTFNTKSNLGAALLGQKKYREAETFLRAGYEGMKQRAAKIPPRNKVRLVEALDRLIALAEATNKPDEAKAWHDQRAKLSAADKKP